MRKICISFIILLLVFTSQVFALEDWGAQNKIQDAVIDKALSEYMEPYKSEDVPENERIISYTYRGSLLDYSGESEGIYKLAINYDVEPYSPENTIWRLKYNYIFIEYHVDGKEWEITKFSETPENYDKFLERFEEYKKNGSENIEVQAVQAEKIENLESNQIEKMSNTIFIVSAIILIFVCIGIIVKFTRKRR